MSALIIGEHNNKTLTTATIATINMASLLSNNLTVLIIGYNCQSVVNQAAILNKVNQVLYINDVDYNYLIAENITNVVISLVTNSHCNSPANNYQFIITPATKFGKNLLPRIAAKLNVEQISEVTNVKSHNTFERTIYAGNAIETVTINSNIKCLTVRASNFSEQFIVNNCTAKIIPLDPKNYFIDKRIKLSTSTAHQENFGDNREYHKNISKDHNKDNNCYTQELSTAKVVVAGGRGLASKENFALVEQLANQLNAAIGASKFAVDAGFVPNNLQIGQTGKIIAPNLYIAIGISGAIQHLAGIRGSKIIIAINSDENAPIVKMANYFIIGDLFKIIPEIMMELEKLKSPIANQNYQIIPEH